MGCVSSHLLAYQILLDGATELGKEKVLRLCKHIVKTSVSDQHCFSHKFKHSMYRLLQRKLTAFQPDPVHVKILREIFDIAKRELSSPHSLSRHSTKDPAFPAVLK